jgi:membrane-associated phospholipid phosphatase
VKRRVELVLSLAFLGTALLANRLANVYITRVGETAPVSPDLVLGWLPGVDVSFVYWWGAAAFIAFAVFFALRRERARLGLFARSYGVLIIARAGLMTLTPLHIPEGAISVDAGVIYSTVGRLMTSHHDLFFSMHTAAPFLAALLFRDRWVSAVCAAFAVVMGITVLLLKTHYSLDVAGAFLVTYALYRLQRRWLEPAIRSALLDPASGAGHRPARAGRGAPAGLL